MMGIATAMPALIPKIGFIVIMDGSPLKMRQDPNAVYSRLTSLVIHRIMREFLCGGNMDPPRFPIYGETRFIIMDNFAMHQVEFALGLKICQLGIKFILEGADRGFIHPVADEMLHELTDTLTAQIFVVSQKAHHSLNVDSILDRSTNLAGKASRRQMAAGTSLFLHLILRYLTDNSWDIKDLTSLIAFDRGVGKVIPALLTLGDTITEGMSGIIDHFQGLPRMPQLTSLRLVGLFP